MTERFEHRLFAVAEDPAVAIDQDERRAFAEAQTRCGRSLSVALSVAVKNASQTLAAIERYMKVSGQVGIAAHPPSTVAVMHPGVMRAWNS
jgi:hypothetical protein